MNAPTMNDRKRAWQILHTEIRRRAANAEADAAWSANIGHIIRDAHSHAELIIELAGFGATFAPMGRDGEGSAFAMTGPAAERLLRVADAIGAKVMQEPDEPEDDYPDDE